MLTFLPPHPPSALLPAVRRFVRILLHIFFVFALQRIYLFARINNKKHAHPYSYSDIQIYIYKQISMYSRVCWYSTDSQRNNGKDIVGPVAEVCGNRRRAAAVLTQKRTCYRSVHTFNCATLTSSTHFLLSTASCRSAVFSFDWPPTAATTACPAA